ncbi:MAG: DUF1059 domain-containing protein [Parcubacteria group bacterium]|jgi:predicted small metal-binding protein
MPTLAGKDIGFDQCDFVASGETIHEVLEKMVDHIEDNHLDEWAVREKELDVEHEKSFLIKQIKDDDRSPI